MATPRSSATGYALFTTRRMYPDELFTAEDLDELLAHGYKDDAHGGLSRLEDTEYSTLWRSFNDVSVLPLLGATQQGGTILSLSEDFVLQNPTWRPSAESPYTSRYVPDSTARGPTTDRATMSPDENDNGNISPSRNTPPSRRSCDGGLDPKDIFSTVPLSDDQAQAPAEHSEMLEDLGLEVTRDSPPIRLHNEDGSNAAMWTSIKVFMQARPLAAAHPALRDFCLEHQTDLGTLLQDADTNVIHSGDHAGRSEVGNPTPSKKLATSIDDFHLGHSDNYGVPPLFSYTSLGSAPDTSPPGTLTGSKEHAFVAELMKQAETTGDDNSAEAYEQAAKLIYFNTIGRTVWKHLDSHDRTIILDNARQLQSQPMTLSANKRLRKARDDITRIEVSDTSSSTSDTTLDMDMVTLAASIYSRLWQLVSSGKQCLSLQLSAENAQYLRVLGRCVSGDIPTPIKLELICLAWIIFPRHTVKVAQGGELHHLCGVLHQQLSSDGLLPGGDDQGDYGPISSMPPISQKVLRKTSASVGLRRSPDDLVAGSALSNVDHTMTTELLPTHPSPADHSTSVLQDLAQYTPLYSDADSALEAFHAPRRQPIEDDESLNDIDASQFVKDVYDAIRATPKDPTPAQTKMIQDLEKRINSLKFPTATLTQVAYLVVDSFFALYKHGDALRPDQIKQIRPTPADNAMTAKQRKKFILGALKATKRLVYRLLDGKDAIVTFVAAPESADQRINKNKVENDWRAEQKKEAEAALEAARLQAANTESDGPSPTKKAKISKRTAVKSAPATPVKSKSVTKGEKATETRQSNYSLRSSPRKRGHSVMDEEELGDAQEGSEEE